MKPKELFVFVTSTATIVHGGWIWDPDCLNSECVGDPLVGDGFSSFDDWTGSRKYSTKVHFTCNEGIGFDLYDDWNNAPTMIYMQCGRQCEEGTYGRYHYKAGQGTGRCKYDQGLCYPDWLYSFTPEFGDLPACSIGDQEQDHLNISTFTLLLAACDKTKLPSVGYSSNSYSSSELVPGETATITCSSGYEFKGELVPTATEMPQLPPGQREPARGKRTIRETFF